MNNGILAMPEVKVKSFQVITWSEATLDQAGMRQIIIMYALGEDGVLYEYANGGWLGLPIDKEHMREPPPALPVQKVKRR
jgi:hypothetical protein